VRTSIESPGRIFSRATATPILPDSSLTVDRPGIRVIVSAERSRIVTAAPPPFMKTAGATVVAAMTQGLGSPRPLCIDRR